MVFPNNGHYVYKTIFLFSSCFVMVTPNKGYAKGCTSRIKGYVDNGHEYHC